MTFTVNEIQGQGFTVDTLVLRDSDRVLSMYYPNSCHVWHFGVRKGDTLLGKRRRFSPDYLVGIWRVKGS